MNGRRGEGERRRRRRTRGEEEKEEGEEEKEKGRGGEGKRRGGAEEEEKEKGRGGGGEGEGERERRQRGGRRRRRKRRTRRRRGEGAPAAVHRRWGRGGGVAAMAPLLACRPGDPQALKACAAASLAGQPLDVRPAGPATAAAAPPSRLELKADGLCPLSDPNAIAKYLGAPVPPWLGRRNYSQFFCRLLPATRALRGHAAQLNTKPRLVDEDLLDDLSSLRVMSVLLDVAGGLKLVPDAHALQIEGWLEWEERALRPASLAGPCPSLAAALQHLESALKGRFLVGDGPTLADIVIYSTALPLTDVAQVQFRPTCQRQAAIVLRWACPMNSDRWPLQAEINLQ